MPAKEHISPCLPSPCGSFSLCMDRDGYPSCSCLNNYIGSPPNCRPECTINSECVSNEACIYERCRDPCPGSCGSNANCRVVNHTPMCTCPEQYTGDPFTNCFPEPQPSRKLRYTYKIYLFQLILLRRLNLRVLKKKLEI